MMNTSSSRRSSSSCLTGVRVKAQDFHLEVNQVLALEKLHVVLRVLFILNIVVIVNTGISSHTKLTQYHNCCFEYHGYRQYRYIATPLIGTPC